MANSEEDFSFPATTLPCFIESPPLWRTNSSSLKKYEQVVQEAEEDDEEKFNLCDDHYGQEDKMDMLWEGLNEDSSSSSSSSSNCGEITEKSSINSSSPGKEAVHICCVNNLFKLPKTTGDMLCGKKSSIPVIIRVLKKGFAIHHSLPSVKKCTW